MDWESPQAPSGGAGQVKSYGQAGMMQGTPGGLLDPLAFVHFILRNLVKIMGLTVVLTLGGVLILQQIPFPFKAKALVLVDPRERRITPGEEAFTGIGSDAAVLESVVEIMVSDGFLRPVVRSLDVRSDPQFQEAFAGVPPDDDRKVIQVFRQNLDADRLGATYVVEIAYTSKDPVKSAFYANGVAEAFVASQKDTRSDATSNAADALSGRLGRLREALQESEKAVATFKNENGIVGLGNDGTVLQRELSSLTQQIALAKTTTEEARARYDQSRLSSAGGFSSDDQQGEGNLLSNLRQQRGTIAQNLAELNLTFGGQHPRIVAERTRLVALDEQIALEQQRLVALNKKRLDAAVASQRALEEQMTQLTSRASVTEKALVELADLQRQATADRQIYEDFLSRFKTTDQQREVEREEAKVVSAATPPLKSTKPGLTLAGGLIGIVSAMISVVAVFIWEAFRGPGLLMPVARAQKSAAQVMVPVAEPAPVPADLPVLAEPVKSPAPEEPRYKRSRLQAALDVHRRAFSEASKADGQSIDLEPDQKRGVFKPKSKKREGAKTEASSSVVPAVKLPLIAQNRLRNEDDLDETLAWYLTRTPDLLALPKPDESTVVLVSSWSSGEGKTSVSQAIATFADGRNMDPVLIKTQINSQRENRRLAGEPRRDFSYPVIDPASKLFAEWDLDLSSLDEMGSLIKRCKQSHGVTVLDTSNFLDERNILRVAAMCDHALVVFDPAQTLPERAGRVAEDIQQAASVKVDIVMNKTKA